jgi:glycogen synthase
MRTYTHWLKIDGTWSYGTTAKAYQKLMDYLNQHPNSKVTVFTPNYGFMFNRYIRLECSQNYNDLDLDCNSMFDGSLIRLTQKPKDVKQSKKDFQTFYNIYTEGGC